jgi:hypothetical protein
MIELLSPQGDQFKRELKDSLVENSNVPIESIISEIQRK